MSGTPLAQYADILDESQKLLIIVLATAAPAVGLAIAAGLRNFTAERASMCVVYYVLVAIGWGVIGGPTCAGLVVGAAIGPFVALVPRAADDPPDDAA